MLDYVRWVMVRKRDEARPRRGEHVPRLADGGRCRRRSAAPARRSTRRPRTSRSPAAPHRFGDYAAGERIDHVDGMTVEEAEHQLATRLYQNTAACISTSSPTAQGRFGRRLIYGGHVISLARALSFNGLANAFHIAAINGGRHVAPLFAGDTVYAWSEMLATARTARARRCRRAAHAHGRDQEPACADFPSRTARATTRPSSSTSITGR